MVTSIVNAIADAFNGLLSKMGSGIADCFQALFLKNTGTAAAPVYGTDLTSFATVALVLVGIGLAIGIFQKLFSMVKRG